jgi:hypothetical protein
MLPGDAALAETPVLQAMQALYLKAGFSASTPGDQRSRLEASEDEKTK